MIYQVDFSDVPGIGKCKGLSLETLQADRILEGIRPATYRKGGDCGLFAVHVPRSVQPERVWLGQGIPYVPRASPV